MEILLMFEVITPGLGAGVAQRREALCRVHLQDWPRRTVSLRF